MSQPSDVALRDRVFSVEDPEDLPEILDHLPITDELPEIEFAYDLIRPGTKENKMVRCVHCKKEARNHSRGYVMKTTDTGKRFLIGRNCGAKHYGAQFGLVDRQFHDQRRRRRQLLRLDKSKALLPNLLRNLKKISESPALKIFEDTQVSFLDLFSELARYLALAHSGELIIPIKVRDYKAEEKDADRLKPVYDEWEKLTTTEKKKRRKEGREPPKLQERFKTLPQQVGNFRGQAFIRQKSSLSVIISDAHSRIQDNFQEIEHLITDRKSTTELRNLLNRLTSEINRVLEVFDLMASMQRFLSRENLESIVSWADRHPEIQGQYKVKSGTLTFDNADWLSEPLTLILPENFTIPSREEFDDFLYQLSHIDDA